MEGNHRVAWGHNCGCFPVPPPPMSTFTERPDFTDAIILRKGASVEHVVSCRVMSRQRVREVTVPPTRSFRRPSQPSAGLSDTSCGSRVAAGRPQNETWGRLLATVPSCIASLQAAPETGMFRPPWWWLGCAVAWGPQQQAGHWEGPGSSGHPHPVTSSRHRPLRVPVLSENPLRVPCSAAPPLRAAALGNFCIVNSKLCFPSASLRLSYHLPAHSPS